MLNISIYLITLHLPDHELKQLETRTHIRARAHTDELTNTYVYINNAPITYYCKGSLRKTA